MSPFVFVPLLVGAILVLQACVWIPILIVMRRRNAARTAELAAELAQTASRGERCLCGPIVARVRGGHVGTAAVVALTNERLIVIASKRTDIPLTDVLEVRAAATFNSSIRGGFRWVILRTKDRELGVSIRTAEHAGWVGAVESVLRAPSAATGSGAPTTSSATAPA